MQLKEIDKVSITILIDNYTDILLPNTPHALRMPMIKNERFLHAPVAEHGFSALIKVYYKIKKDNFNNKNETDEDENCSNTFLFDAGVSEEGIITNSGNFGVMLEEIEALILSHGHFDHFTGILKVLDHISKPIDIIVHPDAFLRRWLFYPDGRKVKMPVLVEQELVNKKAIIHKNKIPNFLPLRNSDRSSKNQIDEFPLLVTGQIPRETSFEMGFPFQYIEDPDRTNLSHDPLVNDDQAIVVNIRNKGLVIISGCSHAGIINTINYAKKLTGISRIYAIIGGFHLAGGKIYEDAINSTIVEIQKADPKWIVPCHCTGWKAVNRIINSMPEKFIQTSVGTVFEF
jgi:7,8-dihydropterin-6-yl-methyl-4-(beta-D-ribofuranosyl)aminobenzene 5'-phosphate synthase